LRCGSGFRAPPAWTLVVALAVFALASKVAGGGHGLPDVAIDGLTGGSYLACGLALRNRRRAGQLARLLILASSAWFAEDLVTSRVPVIFAAGHLLQNAVYPCLAMLALAFPDGRLHDRAERVVVRCAVASSIGLAGLILLTDPPSSHGTYLVGPSVLHIHGAAAAIMRIQDICGLALTTLILCMLVRRQRRLAPGSRRRAIFTRGTAVSAVMFAGLSIHDALTAGRVLTPAIRDSFGVLESIALVAFPICIAGGLLMIDAQQIRVSEIASTQQSVVDVQAALRAVLHDPLLQIAASLPPTVAPSRQITPLWWGSRAVGALIHAPALAEEAELLHVVSDAAAAALGRAHAAEAALRTADSDPPSAPPAEPRDAYSRSAIGLLSPRQRQVLALLADGHSNAMIAKALGITTKTVEKHVRNIYDVLELPAELRLNRRVGATVTWMNADMDGPPG